MEETAPPLTDDPVNALLEEARQFVLRLLQYIDSVFLRLGTARPGNALLRKLTTYALVPAETALRRAILILADDMPIPQRAARARAMPGAPGPQPGAVSPPEARVPRAPAFNMREPQPRPKTGYLSAADMPRIRVLTDDVLCAPSPAAASPKDPVASFTRRLAALHGALNNPRAVAARWLRRHFAGEVPKPCPLSPHRIPGLRRTMPPGDKETLRSLTDYVFSLFTPADTS